ncbi:hypothetical protein RhiirA1_445785 [Rhizophagus irregularis]|uniref:Ion transport domain-containing protein n=2 Tax=Rhizophagus irregularis TaxID=588596 RepID=A0A2N0R5A0_9GLOM|nr:hypothetical protein RhiirA1_445785 [Rhizophagus irregularis]
MSDITVQIKNSNIDNIDEIKIDHDDEIKVDDDIDIDEIKIGDIGNDIDKPHNGEPISKIEISPNEEYLVTYSKYDRSIAGWNINECPFKPELFIKLNSDKILYQIFVSDDKKLAYIDYNDDLAIQLHNFMNRSTCLIPSLIPLLSGSIIKELYWDKCLDRLKEKGQLSKKCQARSLLNKIRTTTKYVFGIRDGHILKIKHEEILAKNSSKFEIPIEIIENWYVDDDFMNKKETYKSDDLLNIIFNNKCMDTIHALFQKINHIKNNEVTLTQNLIKWKLKLDKGIISLKVFGNNNTVNSQDLICAREENINADQYVLGYELFNDCDIIIMTTIGLFIYHFNENNKSISLNYYYYMKINKEFISPVKDYYLKIGNRENIIKQLKNYKEIFSKPTLPLSNYDSLKHYDKWETYIKDNKERLLKYGVELLTSAVKEHNLDLIEDIYKKCINYFKEDLGNNRMFLKIFKHTTTPTIIFMNPYIKFVNYPQKYNWSKELLIKPQYSPFVETINKDIYKTWDGETIIDFKWNNYGKYYYALIWIVYMAFLGCFTAAATIPQQYIDEDIQSQLLIASIILGFIHLSFEIRQFVYDPIRWFRNFWNIFDIKFLLFFRVFESFGVYFAIMISVGKQIASFLLVLFIIIISFAHTFYILLSPTSNVSFEKNTNNDDPNNPWNIAPAYYQAFADGTVNKNQYFIQPPDGNTNMFVDFGTAIFAMYLFLTGDSSALSNWTYKDNPSLVILIVLFSLLVVVYLMNLLIGLLNNAIEKDNNKASYLVQKAEIQAEIELLYLLPHQRRWHKWFPEIIYYYADADKVRQKIKEMINEGEWNTADGGIDPRFNRSCTGFTNSNFGQLFLNWYVTEDKYSTEATEQVQDDDDDTKIISPVNFISNISLKKRMSKQERDKLLLTLHNFKTELFLSYVDMKFEAALINSSISWYKFAFRAPNESSRVELYESSLKNNEAATIRQRIDVLRISLVLKAIISCWVHVAKTMKAVFNKEFTLDSYEELQLCLKEEFLILPKVFASFVNLPNIHINMHLLMHAKTFGTLVNFQVGIKEMVHRIFKGMVPKTNCKNIDLDLLKRYNTLFAIRHLADGEDKYLIEEQIQNDDVKAI